MKFNYESNYMGLSSHNGIKLSLNRSRQVLQSTQVSLAKSTISDCLIHITAMAHSAGEWLLTVSTTK